jgi:hypothetical protein
VKKRILVLSSRVRYPLSGVTAFASTTSRRSSRGSTLYNQSQKAPVAVAGLK